MKYYIIIILIALALAPIMGQIVLSILFYAVVGYIAYIILACAFAVAYVLWPFRRTLKK